MIKTFEDYATNVEALSFVKDKKLPKWVYPAFGLAGEAGEVLEELKKSIREGDGTEIPSHRLENIKLELGDVLFYIFMVAQSLDLSVEDIATSNIEKLLKRKAERDKKRNI